jgi:hypothetical protein
MPVFEGVHYSSSTQVSHAVHTTEPPYTQSASCAGSRSWPVYPSTLEVDFFVRNTTATGCTMASDGPGPPVINPEINAAWFWHVRFVLWPGTRSDNRNSVPIKYQVVAALRSQVMSLVTQRCPGSNRNFDSRTSQLDRTPEILAACGNVTCKRYRCALASLERGTKISSRSCSVVAPGEMKCPI